MEHEHNPELQAALTDEIRALAEKYGVTPEEVSNIASAMEPKNSPEPTRSKDQSAAKERLHLLVNQLFGQAARMSSNSGRSRTEIPGLMTESGFAPGSTIRVQRSSGEIEYDWILQHYDEAGGTIDATKESPQGTLTKKIPLLEFVEQNAS